jgi:hypothetical protein
LLSSLFAIDICAYAVMSNHYHLVLKVCPEQLTDLSEDEIMDRWCAMFKGPLLIQNYRNGEDLKPFERSAVSDIDNVWRLKLADISWFMRCLNQPIAHQANREDKCTGKFLGIPIQLASAQVRRNPALRHGLRRSQPGAGRDG